MSDLIVYGAPPSQPVKAVLWTCLIKELPFELCIPINPWGPEFEALNPKMQIPTINDDGFLLYEMPAILCYLSDKHGWADLYPTDLKTRSLVNQYLHFHHSTSRLATYKLQSPHAIIAFGGPPKQGVDIILREVIGSAMASSDTLGEGRKTVEMVASVIEKGYFPDDSTYLCGTDSPTIADIACYEELAQLQWSKLFEFRSYPKIERWLREMAKLPAHDVVHAFNVAMGDIASEANTTDNRDRAVGAAMMALKQLGVSVTTLGETASDWTPSSVE